MYLIRLDDASEYMDEKKWSRVENLLLKYSIIPIVGIIPKNQDPKILKKYSYNKKFWDKARLWQDKGWVIALHGFCHIYESKEGGMNPVNNKSEFAGVSKDIQREKIKSGYEIFEKEKIKTNIFFAPSHTFDENTLEVIRENTKIRIINDTISNDIYYYKNFYFLPQQTGKLRRLPIKIVVACYHPNTMIDKDFIELENFLKKFRKKIICFNDIKFNKRKLSVYDKFLRNLYFSIKKIRRGKKKIWK